MKKKGKKESVLLLRLGEDLLGFGLQRCRGRADWAADE